MDNQELKRLGLKVTAPRLHILRILETANDRHMSAEEIYQHLQEMGEEMSLATVYRVLTQFETAGLVRRHTFEGGHYVFELDDGEHHDHILCVRCNKVIEFVDSIIEERQQKMAEQFKFHMTGHSLYIFGLCQTCTAVRSIP